MASYSTTNYSSNPLANGAMALSGTPAVMTAEMQQGRQISGAMMSQQQYTTTTSVPVAYETSSTTMKYGNASAAAAASAANFGGVAGYEATKTVTTSATTGAPQYTTRTAGATYGTTGIQYGAATTQYGAATTQYGAATTQYGAATTQYGAPTTQYGAATTQYGAATTQYGAPTTQYGAATTQYGAATTQYGGATQYATGSSAHSTMGAEYEKSRSVVSSNIVSEQFMSEMPRGDNVRYVEVPVVQEVVKHVPVQEVVEVVKHVPKPYVEYVDRVVEVPQIEWVTKEVDVPHVEEVVRTVAKKEVVNVPKEVIKHMPKIETVTVEKLIEVPGQVIEVPKPYTVENKVAVTHFNESQVPVVVAQTVRPYVIESHHDVVDAEITEYEPQIIPVDVHISKPVAAQLVAVGMREQFHRVVEVPAAQYNTLVKVMNPTIVEEAQLPYIREGMHVPLLNTAEYQNLVYVPNNVQIEGYKGAAVVHHGITGSGFSHSTRQTQYSNITQQDAGMYVNGGMHQTGYGTVTTMGVPMTTTRSVTSHSERHHHSHHDHHDHHSHHDQHHHSHANNGASQMSQNQTNTVVPKAPKKKVCC